MLTLDHLNNRRTSLLGARRRDSGTSVASGNSAISNLSKYSHLSQGKMCITLQVESLRYLKSSDEYDIKFGDASIISLDLCKKHIRCKIKANRMKQIHEELDEDELSSILDDIDYDIDRKPTAQESRTPNDKTVEHEWAQIAPKRRDKKDKAYGSCCVGDCHQIERIAFMMKYFSIFMKFKALGNRSSDSCGSDAMQIYSSMTNFMKRLKGYNRTRLLSDYYHVKKYHMNNDSEKELLDYIKTKVSVCNDIETCCCLTRNEGQKQIYRRLSSKERRELYYICDETKDGSEVEMNEIALISYLDIIHSLFIHSTIISNGNKFLTQIEADRHNLHFMSAINRKAHDDIKEFQTEGGADDDADTMYEHDDSQSDISTIPGVEYKGIIHRNVPLLKSSFGQSFDYWKSSHPFYCRATYADLRREILSNNIHSMSSDDFDLLMIKANDYLRSDIGKNLQCKREFRWMKKSIKYGDKITINHVVCMLIATNYCDMIEDFRNIACRKMDNNETMNDVKKRHCEIANFLRFLKESIWCFGDVLSEKQRVYHGINTKIAFPKCSVSFDRPSSVTTKYLVAQKIADQNANIVLKLGKVLASEQSMAYLDVSNYSYYPAEKEKIIFGGNLGFVDIIYSGSSHSESVLSLTLYQQIISGKWFNEKENIFYKKKYQRKIVKMMNYMINYDEDHTVHRKYMQQLFECITKYKETDEKHKEVPNQMSMKEYVENNVMVDNKKTVWINKKECESLIHDLSKILFNKYITYLMQNGVRVKYGHSIDMKLSVPHINDSSFKKSLYSKKYKFVVNHDGDKCSLHFRCYKKYDSQKEEDMFRGFIATQSKLPKNVSKIELKYGLQFDELPYKKWDGCILTNSQLYKGSSLFKMKDIQNFDTLTVKIVFQVRSIFDSNGKWIEIE